MKLKMIWSLILGLIYFNSIAQNEISILPNIAIQNQSVSVKITGINTNFTNGVNYITFIEKGSFSKEISISNLVVVNNTTLTGLVNISAKANTGYYTVRIENSENKLINLFNGFLLLDADTIKPSIVRNEIGGSYQGEEVKFLITGKNTHFKDATKNTIKFYQQDNESFNFFQTFLQVESNTILSIGIYTDIKTPLGVYSIKIENEIDGIMALNNYFKVDKATGTNELKESTTKIFPNPAKNLLNIESKNNIASFQLFDLMGKEILNKIPEKSTQNIQLNLTEIAISKGIYFIKVQSNEGLVTQKIVIE